MKEWLARSVGITLLGVVLCQGASAASIRLDSVVVDETLGSSGGTVHADLYLDGFHFQGPPPFSILHQSAFGFDPVLGFTPPISVINSPSNPQRANTNLNDSSLTGSTISVTGNILAILLFYATDPGPFDAVDDGTTRLATIAFDVPAGTLAGTYPLALSDPLITIPLPPAVWLFGGALAMVSIFRRRNG